MKKRILSLILALVLALSLCAVPAFAAANSLDNFTKTNTYSNTFTDIPAGHWATSVIKTCYEYGLMNGTSANTFDPTGDLTIAQALVMACRVHEIYATGKSTLTNGSPWYQPYVDYAIAKGIVAAGEFTEFNAKATRGEMAHIFCNALPASAIPEINYVEYIPDVDETTPYADEIMLLYKAGILTGSDAFGTFRPDSNISRAEAAAIIARIAILAERKVGHELLEDWYLGDTIYFSMPQGTSITESTDSSAVLESMDGTYNTFLSWAENPGYADLTVQIFTVQEWQTLVVPPYEESGVTLSGTKTELVHFGSVPAYRTVSAVSDGIDNGHMVIIGFIADSQLVICHYLVTENDSVTLHTIANQFRLHDSYASPKL